MSYLGRQALRDKCKLLICSKTWIITKNSGVVTGDAISGVKPGHTSTDFVDDTGEAHLGPAALAFTPYNKVQEMTYAQLQSDTLVE